MFVDAAIELGGGSLIEARSLVEAENAHGLEQPQSAERVGVGGVLGCFEADLDVALGREVIDLGRLHFLDDADQVCRVRHVAVVQAELDVGFVGVPIEVVHACGVERRRAPLDAVNFVAFGQQKLGEVSPILAGDAGDECDLFGHCECSMNLGSASI